MPSPQRSLGHSLFKQKFSQKFLCFFVLFFFFFFFFFCVLFFYFFKISKFALPGVMLIYERTSIDRKKERKKFKFFQLRDKLQLLEINSPVVYHSKSNSPLVQEPLKTISTERKLPLLGSLTPNRLHPLEICILAAMLNICLPGR